MKNCTCCYFDDIIRFWDTDIQFSDILLDQKFCKEKYKNTLIYTELHTELQRSQNHCELGLIKQLDLLKFMIKLDIILLYYILYIDITLLVLFDQSYCDKFYDKIKYLIGEKKGITDCINHNFERIRFASYDSLTIKKELNFHNVIILFKSVVNKNKNEYYYDIFLEKVSISPIQNVFK